MGPPRPLSTTFLVPPLRLRACSVVCFCQVSPDGGTVASGSWTCLVKLWDIEVSRNKNQMIARQNKDTVALNNLSYPALWSFPSAPPPHPLSQAALFLELLCCFARVLGLRYLHG